MTRGSRRSTSVGAALSIGALASLLYAIIEAPNHGWTGGPTLETAGIAVAFGAAFAVWELRAEYPMLDLRFFRNRRFSSGSAAITLIFFAMFGTFFLFTQYLQLVLGYGALEAGLRSLPAPLMIMVTAPMSARLAERFGTRAVVASGLATVAAGLGVATMLDIGSPYWLLALSLVVLASGMGLTMAPSTAAIMSSLPLGKAGVGSAVNDTTRELGGALGVAVLGSLAASRYAASVGGADGLTGPSAVAARRSLGAALQVAGTVGGERGAAIATVAKHAFVEAMGMALTVAALVALTAAVLIARFMPGRADADPVPQVTVTAPVAPSPAP